MEAHKVSCRSPRIHQEIDPSEHPGQASQPARSPRESFVEVLIVFVALVSIGLFATRFGVDSRPTLRSDEHRLALTGMEWDQSTAPGALSAVVPPNHVLVDAPIRILTWTPGLAARSGSSATSFPVLHALDRARGSNHPAFATDPYAALLERRARHLTDHYWSEFAWLTGRIDQSRFSQVCNTLERDRNTLRCAGEALDEMPVNARLSSIAS
jgi:hypothetical protein